MVMHFPDCFYFLLYVIQGQGIIHDLFESKLKLIIRIRCLCIKSYRVVGRTSYISKSIKSYITSRNRIWDLIVSVPDYCLSFYSTII